MQLDFTIIADRATADPTGKINMLGAGVAVIGCHAFPAPLNIALVSGFEYHPTEAGRHRQLTVQLIDEDGAPVIDLPPTMMVPEPPAPGIKTSLIATALVEIIGPEVLPKAGLYSFEISLDGNHVKSKPFQVIDASQMQQAA